MKLRTFALGLAFVGLCACHHRGAEGPAQRAGESIDNAADKTKDATKDAAHEVKKKVDGR